jgi:glycine/D-amino acid oxidase-like deaminating enzyme/nitrite reductase/ring-hydroxylating ferredoxin subunit
MRSSELSKDKRSLWMSVEMPTTDYLNEDLVVDACIIGSGIAGLTVAYRLLEEGLSVAVLESKGLGSGMTSLTTAHLSHVMDRGLSTVERLHGTRGAQLAVQSHTAAIEWIEHTVVKEAIACDFERVDGYLFASTEDDISKLDEEWEAVHRIGQTNVSRNDSTCFLPFMKKSYLRFTRQAQFHPLKYLSGLAQAIQRMGGRLYSGTHVVQVTSGPSLTVKTLDGRNVSSHALVVATNTPITNVVTLHTKQAAYMTYAIATEIPMGSVPKALYWDTDDPYHYVRVHSDHIDGHERSLLIVGGEDHKTGQADDGERRYAALEAWMRKWFPMAKEVSFNWAGRVMESIDGLAYIGRNPGDSPNVYVATGDSGMGITHGTIAGFILPDLVMNRPSSLASLYDPSRQALKAAATFLSESLNMAAQYGDWLTSGDVASEEDISLNDGAIIRDGLHKIAVYRDHAGVFHRCSAVCPHLACIVAWNPSQNTWDCPCHGSQFDRFGKVMNGPAISSLSQLPVHVRNVPS